MPYYKQYQPQKETTPKNGCNNDFLDAKSD
jgi:hypothetical protein